MATTRLAITELTVGQATKEITINENMWRLDALVQGIIQDRDLTAPDGSETEGDLFLLAGAGTGDWDGKDATYLAHYYNSSWHFYSLKEGMRFWVADEDVFVIYNGSTWETVTTT